MDLDVNIGDLEEDKKIDIGGGLDLEDYGITTDELKGTDITEDIQGDDIKSVIIRKREVVSAKNCMIELTNVETITKESLDSLYNIVKYDHGDDRETEVYIRNKNITRGIGKVSRFVMYTILPKVVRELFKGEGKLFINEGNGLREHKKGDVSTLVLELR